MRVSDLPHIVIVACALVMVGALMTATHLSSFIWMAWFIPSIIIIQVYMLWGFGRTA